MLTKILVMGILIVMGLTSMMACADYGYQFHFDVVGSNGEITIEDDSLLRKVRLCNESMCEIECANTSQIIRLRGGNKGSHELTFAAIPDEGYQVKEWLFNGEIVEGNKSNSYTAKVSSEQNYSGVISVEFEPIPNEI